MKRPLSFDISASKWRISGLCGFFFSSARQILSAPCKLPWVKAAFACCKASLMASHPYINLDYTTIASKAYVHSHIAFNLTISAFITRFYLCSGSPDRSRTCIYRLGGGYSIHWTTRPINSKTLYINVLFLIQPNRCWRLGPERGTRCPCHELIHWDFHFARSFPVQTERTRNPSAE